MKTLVLLLSVGLLLGLALGPAWAQPHRQEVVGAPGREPSGQPQEAASDIPVDDLDRGTPRRAVEGFLQAARARDHRRVAQYLDLHASPPERQRAWDRGWPVTSRSSWTRSSR